MVVSRCIPLISPLPLDRNALSVHVETRLSGARRPLCRASQGAASGIREMTMNVVVVEAPAKAKTINKYLGPGYKVLASFGHVRDLPAKDGSVRPDEDFEMSWEVDSASAKRMKDIADAVKSSDGLILATDPDREGEAISWH